MKKSHALIILAIALGIIVLGSAKIYFGVKDALDRTYTPIAEKDEKKEEARTEVLRLSNMSVLLLGLDHDAGEGRRADAIITATYSKDDNTVRLVRIPRDVYIEQPGYKGKINGLYTEGGAGAVRSAVERYLGIPVTNYVETDFDGLESIVDALGGIDIESTLTIDETNNQQVGTDIHIKEGPVHLSGKEALAYSRIRYIDNDIERGKRQEAVLQAIARKLVSPAELPRLPERAEAIAPHVATDMRFSELVPRAALLPGMPPVIREDFSWHDFEYEGESFVALDEGERERLSASLQKHIGYDGALQPMVLAPDEAVSPEQQVKIEIRSVE